MRDPGYISLEAWNQEHSYRDADWCDIEQDEAWDHVAGSDFFTTSPDRVWTRGVVPAPTDRRGEPPRALPVHPAGSAHLPS